MLGLFILGLSVIVTPAAHADSIHPVVNTGVTDPSGGRGGTGILYQENKNNSVSAACANGQSGVACADIHSGSGTSGSTYASAIYGYHGAWTLDANNAHTSGTKAIASENGMPCEWVLYYVWVVYDTGGQSPVWSGNFC